MIAFLKINSPWLGILILFCALGLSRIEASPNLQPSLAIGGGGASKIKGRVVVNKTGKRQTKRASSRNGRSVRFRIESYFKSSQTPANFRTRLGIPRRQARVTAFSGKKNITAALLTKGAQWFCVMLPPAPVCSYEGASSFRVDVKPTRLAQQRKATIKARILAVNTGNRSKCDVVIGEVSVR